ncbi:MAG: ABC transporter permease [Negativicutes bacterium]
MEIAKRIYCSIGLSRSIISLFVIFLFVMVSALGIDMRMAISDCLVRIGMNGLFTLSLLSSIVSGTGLNFGLPIGVVCGLAGGVISMEYSLRGFVGFFVAVITAVPLAIGVGYLYGKALNRVKGSEMMVSNYLAFSVVSIFCLVWVFFPVSNRKIIWPMLGYGVRTTVTLDDNYSKVLDSFLSFSLGDGLIFPTGMFLFFAAACAGMWIFLRTKTGMSMQCTGANPSFAKSIGIDNDRMRILGTTISTVLGAIGVIVYSQSYGFYQFYNAPLMMAFPAIASILVGGATPRTAKISHVIIGTVLYHTILTLAMPVANKTVGGGSLAEVVRVLVSNGIILYALTKIGGGK